MARMWATTRSGVGTPACVPYIVGKSQTIRAGDWVVLAVETTTSYRVVRKLAFADAITADYTDSTVRGVLGIAAYSCTTDASGYALSQPTMPTTGSLTASASASPIYRVPQIAAALPIDKATGRYQIMVYVASEETIFMGAARTAAVGAVTITKSAYDEATCGIWGVVAAGTIWATGENTVDFGIATDSSGAEICGKIVRINMADPAYNTSSTKCIVGMTVLPTYSQYRTSLAYAS